MKIVINRCYGGWSLSPAAALWLYERGFREGEFATAVRTYFGGGADAPLFRLNASLAEWRNFLREGRSSLFVTVFSPDEQWVLSTRPDAQRAHPLVVECVETLGEKANGSCAKLDVIEIPDGIEWSVSEYDGMETAEEAHRSWS